MFGYERVGLTFFCRAASWLGAEARWFKSNPRNQLSS